MLIFCQNCGQSSKYGSINCSFCNHSFNDTITDRSKSTSSVYITNNSSFGVKLGDKFDFSIFESMAADLEKEIVGDGDEKDLGKWGAKTIDGLELFKDIISKQNK